MKVADQQLRAFVILIIMLLMTGISSASTIEFATGYSSDGFQGSAAAYQSVVNARVASPSGGYGTTMLSSWSVSNQGTFGSNNNIAQRYTVKFGVKKAQAGTWGFLVGGDFGWGGAMFIDGVPLGFNAYDMWWGWNWNTPGQFFNWNYSLAPGNHVLTVYALENCCDGGGQGFIAPPTEWWWHLISTSDGFNQICMVTDTSDSAGSLGAYSGSLRNAINNSNAGYCDTIYFSIGSGLQTITPTSALPTITRPVTIDATTQPGWTSAPIIELNGASAGGSHGFSINSGGSGSTIMGFVINRFGGHGIDLSSANNVTIQGNYIGTNSAGNADLRNWGHGISLSNASSNTIGGTTAAARNVISRNWLKGIGIWSGSNNNVIIGNYIGVTADGAAALGNFQSNIMLGNGSTGNRFGGPTVGERNVISGAVYDGIEITGGSNNTIVQGNYIGTNAAGTAGLGNARWGIYSDSQSTTISGNVVSGNGGDGIRFAGSSNNTVQGNYVGTNAAGTAAIANGGNGVSILAASNNNLIGGTTAAARNIFSGNGPWCCTGVYVDNSTGNTIQGNYIGTDVTGTVRIPNRFGIFFRGVTNTTIGGTAIGAGNLISGNDEHGIGFEYSTHNTIQGNYVGLNAAGTAALYNGSNTGRPAIRFDIGSNYNTVGGATAGARNVISGNTSHGLWITNSHQNTFKGNYIGTNAAGTAAIGNWWGFVLVGASDNVIGGSAAGEGNV